MATCVRVGRCFQRWVAPEEAETDLLRLALQN
jgi:hypothetical protein